MIMRCLLHAGSLCRLCRDATHHTPPHPALRVAGRLTAIEKGAINLTGLRP
jgi:hypothetical protein